MKGHYTWRGTEDKTNTGKNARATYGCGPGGPPHHGACFQNYGDQLRGQGAVQWGIKSTGIQENSFGGRQTLQSRVSGERHLRDQQTQAQEDQDAAVAAQEPAAWVAQVGAAYRWVRRSAFIMRNRPSSAAF